MWKIFKTLKLSLFLFLTCCLTLSQPFNIYPLIVFCAYMVFVLIGRSKLWDINACILVCFGLFYFLITAFYYTPSSWANEIIYLIGPVVCYLSGRYFVAKTYDQQNVIVLIALVCICASLPISILTVEDIITTGKLIAFSRRFTNQEAELAATIYGLISAISLSGLGFFIVARKNTSKIIRICFCALFCLSLLTTIHLINRTGIVVSFVCLIAMMLTQRKSNLFKYFILLSIIVVIVLTFADTNLLSDTVEAYTYRNTEGNSIDSGGGRFDRWTDALSKLWFYPFGWWKDTFTYHEQVHNLWLDIARVAGIVPFLLFLLFTYNLVVTQVKLLRFKSSHPLVLLTFGILLSMLLAAAVEPTMEAKAFYPCLIIFFCGIEEEIYVNRKILLKP